MQHGLLQVQASYDLGRVGIADGRAGRDIGRRQVFIDLDLIRQGRTATTDGADSDRQLVGTAGQVGHAGGEIRQLLLGGYGIASGRSVQCRFELAHGIQNVLGFVGIDRDLELVVGSWRAIEGEGHSSSGGLVTRQGSRRNGLAIGGQRGGIQIELSSAGELQDGRTTRERGVVGRLVGHTGTGHLGSARVTRATCNVEAVWLGTQLERVLRQQRAGVVAGLEVDVQAQVHPPKAHGLVRRITDHTILAGLGRHILAIDIGDLQLGGADERNRIGLALAEVAVVLAGVGHLAIGQEHRAVVRRRRTLGSHLSAAGIHRLLEHIPTSAVGSHQHSVTHRQLPTTLVAVVAIGTVGVATVWRHIILGTTEDVLAVFVLGIHQAEQLLFDLPQLRRIGLTVGIGVAGVGGTSGQFPSPGQDVIDAGHHRLGLPQGSLDRVAVGLVLVEQRSLLAKLQQTRGTDRIVSRGLDPYQAAGFFAAFDHLGEVLLEIGSRRLIKLRRGNTHGLRLLKGC